MADPGIDVFDPTSCVSYRLRRAARLAAKAFDAALKPSGLRNTQFTLLAVLVKEGPKSIGDLSKTMATDGTTLTRNLEILERRGLVEDTPLSEDERVRVVQATREGKVKYREALPLWKKTQRSFLETIDDNQWIKMMTKLRAIEEA